jgi:Ca2+-binding RTX toxin-like protein
MALLNGTPNPDTLNGTNGDDSIYGLAGNDVINADAGVDYIDGGEGDDRINAFFSDKGEIVPYPNITGRKVILGGAGNDLIFCGESASSIDGGAGNDALRGSNGNDTLIGGFGNDSVDAHAGADSIDGGEGNDSIDSGDGNDSISGGEGNDSIDSGDGNDSISGGAGNDSIQAWAGNATLDGGDGDDKLNGFGGSYVVFGGNGNDTISLVGGADSIDGGAGNDSIDSGDGNDSISGGDGNDSIDGGDGNDTLIGGSGNDTLNGGTGNDLYKVGANGTRIIEYGGTDTAEISVNYCKVPSSIENVKYIDGAKRLPYWIDGLINDLASGGAALDYFAPNKTLYFYFPSTITQEVLTEDAKGFKPFTDDQKEITRATLARMSNVIELKFVESSSYDPKVTMSFANNETAADKNSWAYSRGLTNHDIYLNATSIELLNPKSVTTTRFEAVIVHETGHSLGLNHPETQSVAGGPNDPRALTISNTFSVEAPNISDLPGTGQVDFRVLDIAALQYLYGPSKTVRTGDDVYKISETEANFIWDGIGRDTVDASTCSKAVCVYLTPGEWGYTGTSKSNLITDKGQITVNFGTQIENLIGSSFNDNLSGNELANSIVGGDGNDTMTGGAGDDTLVGGTGNDTALFPLAKSNYKITSSSAGTRVEDTFSGGTGGADLLTGIEVLKFADQSVTASTITGSSNAKPAAASSTLTTLEDSELVFTKDNFPFKDSDPSDSLQAVSITALPTKGSLKLSGNAVTLSQSITAADITARKLVYTPVADANGKAYARVGFKVSDGKDFSTSTYYLTVNVDAVNDAPTVAKPITTPLSLIEGKAFSYSLPSGTFKDVDDKVLTYSATGLLAGMVIDSRTGKVSGTPSYTAADLESNTVTIKATDKGGLSASMPLTLNVANSPTIAGSTKDDNIVAGAGADSISGGNGNDTLSGGTGNDTLVGGAGKDVLTGGDGADRFVFDTSLGSSNVDTIKDFVTGTDKIVLSAKVFTKFTGSSTGSAITAGNLVVGAGATAKAADSNDYLIYDTTSDLLYYDKDGSGSGAPVAFVKVELTGTAAPAFGDFLVVT